MRVVIQRVKGAKVSVAEKEVASIHEGLCIFLGIEGQDKKEDLMWLVRKIVNLRIFGDSDGVMNLSVKELKREILLISQFTLHANTKKGNRPSFIRAARPEIAEPLYEKMIEQFQEELTYPIARGIFGANMKIDLCNDGPVTIIIDTKDKDI